MEHRLFCMGDAVHRNPPSNGLGLNMSVADGFNLAWKLVLVLGGHAGVGLLDSYTEERQPVGAHGVQRAITSLREIGEVDTALGYTPGQSAEEGWARLNELYQPGAAGDQRRSAVRAAVEVTNYQFNAHGVELGCRYTGRAIVPDATPQPRSRRDPELYCEATTYAGARVPHARVEVDGVPSAMESCSGAPERDVISLPVHLSCWRHVERAMLTDAGLTAPPL